VLTASITLHSNLECSSTSVDSAFVIGAPNITVNLNGYTISAPPPTSISCCIHGAGVSDGGLADGSVYPPYNGVTVKNGDITGFEESTEADGVSGWRVTGITSVTSAPYGAAGAVSALLDGTTGAVITNDVFNGGLYGVWSDHSNSTLVSGVTITGDTSCGICSINDTSDSILNNDVLSAGGIGVMDGTDITVADNRVAGGGIGDTGSLHSIWKNNTANGIGTSDGNGNTWVGNVSNNGYGVSEISDNDATWVNDTFNNDSQGVLSEQSSGIWVNPTTSNDGGDGMDMTDFSGTITGGMANRDNGNGIDLVSSGNVTLNNNTTNYDETGTLINDESGTVTVENSTANNNVAYGFDATPNATSGRHNTARGNGTTNCVNVNCTS
jgi:hypothetical protein